jgi:flagellar basal body-associated protein FliL
MDGPTPPRKRSRLLLIIGGIVLFIVVVTFVGMNLSHFSEMKGGTG